MLREADIGGREDNGVDIGINNLILARVHNYRVSKKQDSQSQTVVYSALCRRFQFMDSDDRLNLKLIHNTENCSTQQRISR